MNIYGPGMSGVNPFDHGPLDHELDPEAQVVHCLSGLMILPDAQLMSLVGRGLSQVLIFTYSPDRERELLGYAQLEVAGRFLMAVLPMDTPFRGNPEFGYLDVGLGVPATREIVYRTRIKFSDLEDSGTDFFTHQKTAEELRPWRFSWETEIKGFCQGCWKWHPTKEEYQFVRGLAIGPLISKLGA